MKNKNTKTNIIFSAILTTLLALSACKKKDDGGGGGGNPGGGTNAETPANPFRIVNGVCVNGQNQPVSTQNCAHLNGGYYFANGICYNQQNQMVSNQHCNQYLANQNWQQYGGFNIGPNGQCYTYQGQIMNSYYCYYYGYNTVGGGYNNQDACFGEYIQHMGYYSWTRYCSGWDCAGLVLTSVQTGATLTCK